MRVRPWPERERERERETLATVKLELSALDLTIATGVCHYLKAKLTAKAMIWQVSVVVAYVVGRIV